MSVLAAAAATTSQQCAALGPEIDAIRTTSWSSPSSANTSSSVRANSVLSLNRAAVMSAGFSAEPNAGIIWRSPASVCGAKGGRVRPPRTAASANTTPDPPEIDSTPTVLPFGSRPCPNSFARSTMGSTSSTSMMPHWRIAAR